MMQNKYLIKAKQLYKKSSVFKCAAILFACALSLMGLSLIFFFLAQYLVEKNLDDVCKPNNGHIYVETSQYIDINRLNGVSHIFNFTLRFSIWFYQYWSK